VDHDQRGPVHAGQRLGHREGLSRAGDAEQHLMRIAAIQPLDELADGALLVAGQLEIGDEVEVVVHRGHENFGSYYSRVLSVAQGFQPCAGEAQT
jgi:hypothetical protein